MKQRLDKELLRRGLAGSRSQAEDTIRRGFVKVKGSVVTKAGYLVNDTTDIEVKSRTSFVSRAGEKLNSVVGSLQLDFEAKTVLDVGSSTGGFTEFALRNGAKKVIAVDVGTDQMHSSLRGDIRVELHEKTDIRNVWLRQTEQRAESNEQRVLIDTPDMIVVDVSFISLRKILPHCSLLIAPGSFVVAMVKPQFEAGAEVKHKGVIKNDSLRRTIFKEFETWSQKYFVIVNKADSGVSGVKGNRERFYLLKKLR